MHFDNPPANSDDATDRARRGSTYGCTDSVMIVEDDDDIRGVLAAILHDAGYKVLAFRHGGEALTYLRVAAPPCLILLDMMMPVMNGWDFLEAFRHEGDTGIPVVVMSAADLGPSFSVQLTLPKPFGVERLLEVVARFCRPSPKE